MPAARELVRWDVVEEHLDEAEFLFEQWESANATSLRTFDGLARTLESRLLAHVDGLAVGADAVAEELLWPRLVPEAEAATLVAAATCALLVGSDPVAMDRVLARLAELPAGAARDGLTRALVAVPRLDVSARISTRAERSDDAVKAALLPAVAMRGGMPGPSVTAWIHAACRAEDTEWRALAAQLAVLLPRAAALHVGERLVDDVEPRVQCAALQTAIVHGSTGAHGRAVDLARRGPAGALTRASMLCIALTGEPPIVEVLATRLADEATRADALWALGFTGRVDAIDRVMPWVADEVFGPLAAEAIVGIAGLARDDPRLWTDAPASPEPDDDLEAPLPAEDLDADLAPKPGDDLPVPIADAFARAWAELRPRFDPRVRFHEGRPLVQGTDYAEVLARTTLRRRAAIALELAIRSRGAIRIPTPGMSAQQRPHLATLANAGAIDGSRPFARIS